MQIAANESVLGPNSQTPKIREGLPTQNVFWGGELGEVGRRGRKPLQINPGDYCRTALSHRGKGIEPIDDNWGLASPAPKIQGERLRKGDKAQREGRGKIVGPKNNLKDCKKFPLISYVICKLVHVYSKQIPATKLLRSKVDCSQKNRFMYT